MAEEGLEQFLEDLLVTKVQSMNDTHDLRLRRLPIHHTERVDGLQMGLKGSDFVLELSILLFRALEVEEYHRQAIVGAEL
jgi:hypothetical protein